MENLFEDAHLRQHTSQIQKQKTGGKPILFLIANRHMLCQYKAEKKPQSKRSVEELHIRNKPRKTIKKYFM
jgi:hypothetical protein